MDLLIPEVGTIFWTLIVFSIAFFILAKFAWKPLLNALKERDNSIAQALQAAETAKKEVASCMPKVKRFWLKPKPNATKSFRKPVNSKKRC